MIARFLLAGAAIAAAAPATAQALDNDVRCMLISNLVAQAEKDPQRKQLAGVASVFYFGRVSGRLNQVQLKQQLGLAGKIKPGDVGAVMTDCAKQFIAKQQAFMALGKSMAPNPAAGAPAPAKPPAK